MAAVVRRRNYTVEKVLDLHGYKDQSNYDSSDSDIKDDVPAQFPVQIQSSEEISDRSWESSESETDSSTESQIDWAETIRN